jgi:hypothetical protein
MLREHRLRKISGLKREEIKLLNEEFHDFCSSTNIIRVMKSRRMGCAGHWGGGMHTGFWWQNLKKEIMWKTYT